MVKTSPSNVGDVDFIPDQETEIPHGSWTKKKTKHKSNIVTNLIKTVKVVHIKENKTKQNKTILLRSHCRIVR